jgi:drug/metabolite transporter (DMT)-like permease
MEKIKNNRVFYHILAITIVMIWGVTFVNSKVLLNAGMRPEEIFLIRFLLAYVCILFISPRKLFADTWKDELRMLILGVTGGSVYFLAENMAVKISYVNNVSFIVCTAPLYTTIMAILFLKNVRATRYIVIGSALALMGMAMVIFNGHFVFHLSPLGDSLALTAALCWGVYSLLIKGISERYGSIFITRKVFFYGILTILPVFIIHPWSFPIASFLEPKILGNLMFLGLVASFICFELWSLCINKLGALSVSNYVYLNPISTMLASTIFLNEPTSLIAIMCSAMILSGVYLANKK